MEDLLGAVRGDDLIAEVAGLNNTSTSSTPAPIATEGLSVFYNQEKSHWFSQNVHLGSQSIPVLEAANQFYSATDNPSNREAIRSYVARVNRAKGKDWTIGRQGYDPDDDDNVDEPSGDVYRKEYNKAAQTQGGAGLSSGLKNYVDHVQHDKFKSTLSQDLKKSVETAAALADKYKNIENYDNPETLKEMLGILDRLEIGDGIAGADGANTSSSEATEGDNAGAEASTTTTTSASTTTDDPPTSSNMESCFDTPPLSAVDDGIKTNDTTTCPTSSNKRAAAAQQVYQEFVNSLPLKPEAEYLGSGFKVKAQHPTLPPTPKPTPTSTSSSSINSGADKAQQELDLYFNSAEIKGTYKQMFGTSEEEYQELLSEMNPGLARDKYTYNFHHVKGLAKNVLAPAMLPKEMIESSPTLKLYANSYNATGDTDGVGYNFNVPETNGNGGGLLWDPSDLVQQTPKDHVKLDQRLRSKFIAADMVLTVELYQHQQLLPFEQQQQDDEKEKNSRTKSGTSDKPPNITMKDLESLSFTNELEFVQKLAELADKKSLGPTSGKAAAAAKKRARKKILPQPQVCLEIEILISSPIYELMNLFSCEQDYILKDEITDPKVIKRLGVVKQEEIPPVFAPVLVIGSNVYTDVEDPASLRVAAELVLSFNERSHRDGGSGVDFQILPWTLPLSSLNLRFGFRYLYVHRITCEHQVAFTKCRVVRPGETELLQLEPRINVVNEFPIHMCKKHCNELARFIKISPVKNPSGLSGPSATAGATTTDYACNTCAEAALTFKKTNIDDEFKLFRIACPAGPIPTLKKKNLVKKHKKLGRPKRKPSNPTPLILSDEKSKLNDDNNAEEIDITTTAEEADGQSIQSQIGLNDDASVGAGACFEMIYATDNNNTTSNTTGAAVDDDDLGLAQDVMYEESQKEQEQVKEEEDDEVPLERLILPSLCISTSTTNTDNNNGNDNGGGGGRGGENENATNVVVMEFDLNHLTW